MNGTENGGKITPQEFAKKVKDKYPQYANMDDSELVNRMINKYPQYKEQIDFTTTVKPKGAPAEQNGVSASRSAGIDSLLESAPSDTPERLKSTNTDPRLNLNVSRERVGREEMREDFNSRLKEQAREKIAEVRERNRKEVEENFSLQPVLSTNYPELYERKKQLEDDIASKPAPMTVKQTEELEKINKQISDIEEGKNKSFRQIRKEQSEQIKNEMFKKEQNALGIAQRTGEDFQEILRTDGDYQYLRAQANRADADVAEQNQLLEKFRTDEGLGDRFLKSAYVDPLRFRNLFEKLGWIDKPETIQLNEEVEEEILKTLDSNPKMKTALMFGGNESGGAITRERKEQLIQEAKSKVLKNNYESAVKTISDLEQKKRSFPEGSPERSQIEEQQKSVYNKYFETLSEFKYDEVTGVFESAFKKTKEDQEYEESLADRPVLDVVSTFAEGMINTVLGATVGFAGAVASTGDVFADDKKYSVFDAVGDLGYELSSRNILPSSRAEVGKLIDDNGNWNVTPYSIGKTAAEGLPFTLYLMSQVRGGNVGGAYKSLANIFNPKNATELSRSIKMAERAYQATLSENLQEAKELGLDGIKAQVLANTMSVGTGVSQLIMPDFKFFESSVGKTIVKNFSDNLKSATNREAVKKAITGYFKDLGKEIGEEELDAAISEVAKLGMVQGYSSEFDTAKFHKEILGSVLVVNNVVGGVGLKSRIKANRTELYNNIVENQQGLINEINDIVQSTTNPELIEALNTSKQFINDVSNAIKEAPEGVTGKQVDLLIEKKKLVEEMKSKDDAFHPEYKERIEALNEKIRQAKTETETRPTGDNQITTEETVIGETEGGETVVERTDDIEATAKALEEAVRNSPINFVEEEDGRVRMTGGGIEVRVEAKKADKIQDVKTPSFLSFLPKKLTLIHLTRNQKDKNHIIKNGFDSRQVSIDSPIKGVYFSSEDWSSMDRFGRTKENSLYVDIDNDGLLYFDSTKSFRDYLKENDLPYRGETLSDEQIQKLKDKGIKGILLREDFASQSRNELIVIDDSIIKNISESPKDITKLPSSFSDMKSISEAYHKAKADGSNPELVKAVEDLIKPNTVVERTDDVEKFSEISKVTEASFEAEDGHTFNLDGTTYDKGGLVIPVVSKNMKQSELSAEAIQNFIDEHSDKIDGDSVKVGIYKFPNSDEVSIDLNIVAPNSMREEALAFAKEAGQESLFDLDTFENIKTGADGKNPKQFTAEEFKEISKRFSNEQNKTTNQTADETKVEGGTEEGTDTGDDGDVSIDIKERYKQVADGIRQFKLKRPNGFDKLQSNVGTALLSTAWDGAVETIATTVELTGDIDAAIRKGIEYLKGTEWYKSLSKEGKEEAVKIFSQQTTDTFKPMVDAHKPKSKKSTKAIVRQNTGQTDTSKKVVTTEAKALKEKLKAMQQASKLGAKAVQDLKKDFVDYVKAVTEDLKGVMTDAEVKTILNQVKNVTEKNIDRVSDVIDRLVDRVERKQQLQEVSSLKNKVKKIGKSKTKPASLQSLAKDASRLDFKLLDERGLREYKSLLESIYNANRPVSNPEYKPVNLVEAREKLDELNEKAEEVYVNRLAEQLGLEGLGLTKKELEEFKSSMNLDPFEDKLNEAKKKAILDKFRQIAEYSQMALEYADTTNMTAEEKRQLKVLKQADLSEMSLQELKDFTRISDNIVENEILDGARKLVNSIEATKIANDIAKEADGKVIRPAKGLLEIITSPLKKKKSDPTTFEKTIANRMFHHIDTTVRGLKGTVLYNNIIHPLSSVINNVDTVLTQNFVKNTYNLFKNAVDKNTDSFTLNKKVWMYLRQNEYELNKDSSNKKFFGVEDYVEAYLSKRGRDEKDAQRVKEILNEFTKPNGKIFSAQEMYDTFTPAQKKLIDQIKKDYAERTEAERFHSTNFENKHLDYFDGYAPLRVSQRDGKEIKDPSQTMNMMQLTTASSFERVASKAAITEMDAILDYESYIKESFYKTDIVPVYNKAIQTARKMTAKNGDIGSLGEALEKVIREQASMNISRAYRSESAMNKIWNRYVKNTFPKVLIKPTRLIVETPVNWGTFLLANPEMATKAFSKKVSGVDKEFMKIFAKEHNSTHASRIGASSVDKRFVDSSPFDKFAIRKSDLSLIEKISDLYNSNYLNQVNDWLTEHYYKFSDPTVFAWKNYLIDEFKKQTGQDLDTERFKTDSTYRESIKEDMDKVIAVVDKKASRIGNTGATAEQKLVAQRRRGTWTGMFQDFMKSFGYNENSEIRDAFHGMLGRKEATSYDNKTEALKMFVMLNARSLVYSYGMQAVASSLANVITGADDDDDYEKMIQKTIGQHGMLILLGNRSATWNIGAAIILEMFNAAVVKSDKKKYDPYKDSVFFAPSEKGSLSQYLSLGGAGGSAVKTLYDGALAIDKAVTEGDNRSAYQQAKANRVFMDFLAQLTGSGLLAEMAKYNYELDKAAKKKPSGKTLEEIKREKGLK